MNRGLSSLGESFDFEGLNIDDINTVSLNIEKTMKTSLKEMLKKFKNLQNLKTILEVPIFQISSILHRLIFQKYFDKNDSQNYLSEVQNLIQSVNKNDT